MLRLIPTHRTRIPNRLAVIGAMLLFAAAAAGINAGADAISDPGQAMAKAEPATEGTVLSTKNRADKSFKVRLFLFRRN